MSFKNYLQILAVLINVNLFMILPFVTLILTAYYVFYVNYIGNIILILYLIYIYLDNNNYFTSVNYNGWLLLRKNYMTNLLSEYFPIELIKTAELKANRNYIFASFPHGIVGTGIVNNMANNIGRFQQLYPGLRPKIATLNMICHIPLYREFLRCLGFVPCTRESLTYILSKSNDPAHKDNSDGFTSNAVAILVGGVREIFETQPGRYVFTLKNRKGFVKIAIKTGSFIVPTISFGECEIFEETSKFPEFFVEHFQTLALICNFFRYCFGFMPKKQRIVQVVGAPIVVNKMSQPSPEYVEEIHQKVIANLNEMFSKYKYDYMENANNLNIVFK